jgi:hypothetical protein
MLNCPINHAAFRAAANRLTEAPWHIGAGESGGIASAAVLAYLDALDRDGLSGLVRHLHDRIDRIDGTYRGTL